MPGWQASVVAAVFSVLFVGPIVATGELGVWRFEEPVSHLVWDEAMEGPGEDGRTLPGPGAELSGPGAMWLSFVALPALLGMVTALWARRMARADPPAR